MQHRWDDVNGTATEDDNRADFIGGAGDADLWIVPATGVLICTYEDIDQYVSYFPAAAVLDHAKGVLTYENTPKLEGRSVTDAINLGKRMLWHSEDSVQETHKPADIARYLAVFYPDALNETERKEALGITLTEQEATTGELK